EQVQRLPSARAQASRDLAGLLPDYLALLSRLRGSPAVARERDEVVQSDLFLRLRQGHRFEDVVSEYTVLGRCIAETWSEALAGEAPEAADVEFLFAELDRAVAKAAAFFGRQATKQEESEDRCFSMLQRACHLSPSDRPLSEYLRDVLSIV